MSSALEDPTPQTFMQLCHSMIEENIWDLSHILLSGCAFFPFGHPPLSNNSLFFVKLKQSETECLEHQLIWSQARERVKDREKGRKRQKEMKTGGGSHKEKARERLRDGSFPFNRAIGTEPTCLVLVLQCLLVQNKLPQRKGDKERQKSLI